MFVNSVNVHSLPLPGELWRTRSTWLWNCLYLRSVPPHREGCDARLQVCCDRLFWLGLLSLLFQLSCRTSSDQNCFDTPAACTLPPDLTPHNSSVGILSHRWLLGDDTSPDDDLVPPQKLFIYHAQFLGKKKRNDFVWNSAELRITGDSYLWPIHELRLSHSWWPSFCPQDPYNLAEVENRA